MILLDKEVAPMFELPKTVRVALGAASYGISDRRLTPAVTGKVILVTGASSGVGRATAHRLAAHGATVIAVARRAALLEQLRTETAGFTGSVHPYPADLSNPDDCAALIERVLAEHGHIDVFVNNAGKSIRRWLSDSLDRWDNVEDTARINYLGPVRLVLSLLPSMRARRDGHIVNISTAGVHAPAVGWTAYIATKSAFNAWMRGAAPELRADGISVSTVHLQLVRSDMLGPYRIYRYTPSMSTEEAASLVCRAIVDRPLAIRPWWERAAAPVSYALDNSRAAQRMLTLYAKAGNWNNRPVDWAGPIGRVEQTANLLDDAVTVAGWLPASGVLGLLPPSRIPQLAFALRDGAGLATTLSAFAARFPDRPAMIDDDGPVTAAELDRQVRRLAAALRARWDIRRGQRVGVLCRNHRGFVVAAYAAARLSADLVPLNYGFAGPQIGEVLARERVELLLYDGEFHTEIAKSGYRGRRVVVRGAAGGLPTMAELVAASGPPVREPAAGGSIILLTGGTTGVPKGAPRQLGWGAARTGMPGLRPRMVLAIADLARVQPIPRLGEPMVIAPPLHHTYGFLALVAAFLMGSTVLVHERFDAATVLADIERHRVRIACLVPTMLQRIMALPPAARRGYRVDSLQMVVCGAAPLPPWLATAFLDEFGDVLFNGYASTETGAGTIATPADLRAAPGTVGRPPTGIVDIRIVDREGREVPVGVIGRVVNKNPSMFHGYSDGRTKEMVDGYMDSGDLGHFDAEGRLYIDGRSDDMIVSGGENVFPQEVEEALLAHPAVADAGAVGVADDDFGQRLAAAVVLEDGRGTSVAALQRHIKATLANYKVPRDIVFVPELPRTTAGKLRRQQLPEVIARARAAAAVAPDAALGSDRSSI
ncbi:SDR family NAD(P)-dependent oxidoreductase [Nocardia yunnanensis]|uniref:SDR family NAD(P)-dependent oxidoreductase n=1 Tax=Nocardia yunnanensis TaxID=2382165 RepID=A0A386ZKI2_9NOCA|nr:SDR family NAD(P)-dependent oxidoreductase [Nocardia yunnanensis]AYF77928.1 SDR family NAD(P)-dependent oxidoreductase [Nocardia yunnanensis]